MKNLLKLSILLLLFSCSQSNSEETTSNETDKANYFTSPLGKKLTVAQPSENMLAKYEEAKANFEKNPADVENYIWLGRRIAYLGRYEEAIGVYSKAIEQFPNDARLYRHRGHRYISIRKFDEAIQDFEKAVTLIEGKENEIEPDGLPNHLNIPISSLHGNIWYHLGLAYYLKHDYENAYRAYKKCRELANNYDNIVSSTNWLYMIQRRMGNDSLAIQILDPIVKDSSVIENMNYYSLCKLYKGFYSLDSINTSEEGLASYALKYGVANYYFYNGDKEKAKTLMDELLESDGWASFGYIAAESDVLEYYP